MNLVLELFKVYGEVACFRRSPKSTPSSTLMLGVALILVVIATLIQLFLAFEYEWTGQPFWFQFAFTCFDLLVLAGFFWLFLSYYGHRSEFQRMFTAWLMFVFIINCGFCILMALLLLFKVTAVMRILFLIFTLGFSLWSVIFMLNLFRTFFTPVVWQAALIYLVWMAIHFGLVNAYQWMVVV